MSLLTRLLILTFIESVGSMLVERGVYFYAHDRMGFVDTANLWLALGIGTFFVIGALLSNRLARRFGQKRLLALLLGAHCASHVILAAVPHVAVLVAVNLVLAAFTAAKWPIFESYISAGRNAQQTSQAIGKFNISWS